MTSNEPLAAQVADYRAFALQLRRLASADLVAGCRRVLAARDGVGVYSGAIDHPSLVQSGGQDADHRV